MRVLKLIGGLLILLASPAMAGEGGAWVLTQKSGDVRVLRNGLQPASLQLRAALVPGDVIATGATGRAMLTNGDDYVVVAPASRLVLPKEQAQTGFTRLMQQVGTMLYKVRHTGVPHFAVETPLLAAVVKGTSFTIVVDKDRAAVQVTDGIVEVSSAGGAARRLVERGATVYVGRARPDAIVEVKAGEVLPARSGDAPAVKIDRSGDVPLSAVASLTSGLLQPVPAAPLRVVNIAALPAGTVTAAPASTANGSTPASIAAATATPISGGATPGATAPVTVAAATPVVSVSTSTPASVTATPLVTATLGTPAVSTPVASVPPVTASVSLPTASTPAVTAAVSVPAISTPTVTAVVSIPTVSTPTVTAVITAPAISTPTVTATVAVPIAPAPALPTPTVVATVTTPTITTPTVAVSTPVTPAITVPSISLPGIGLTVGIR